MMISGIRPVFCGFNGGKIVNPTGKTPARPSEEEFKAAGYPMTYKDKNGEIWHRNIAAECGKSDDFDCDREGDPDYMIYPGQYYLSNDVWEHLQKSIRH